MASRLRRADVVVIGAAAAGVAAAIEAAERGLQVIVVEAARRVGGTASTAGAGTCVAGSPLQSAVGIEDSPEQALADWLAWGGSSVDEEWARRYLWASVTDVFERFSEIGVEWVAVQPKEGNSVPRWHQPKGGGLSVMRLLERAARACPSISWHLGTRARHLVRRGGAVCGLVAEDADGEVEFTATSVVVATGGFNNNLDMVRRNAVLARSAERILLGGGRGAVGQGHAMLEEVGARFTNLEAVWMFPYGTPDYRDPDSHRGLAVRGLEGDLWVNQQGVRFHNEALRGGATGTVALLAQPGGNGWSVIDRRIAARFTVADPYYRHGSEPLRDRLRELLDESPYIVGGDTLRDLAARMDVDGSNLRETVEQSNRSIADGEATDPAFGKPLAGVDPLSEPPFYAIRLFPVARKNLGGVCTNLECQVIGLDGRPVDGLFAAGEVAGMAGGRINGGAALEGTSFGPSFYSGRVAGRNVAA